MRTITARRISDGRPMTVWARDHGRIRLADGGALYRTEFSFDGGTVLSDVDAVLVEAQSVSRSGIRYNEDILILREAGIDISNADWPAEAA